MKNRAGAITVAGNIYGPLDLAREDPMTTINSQYHIGNGVRGHTYMGNALFAMSDSDIAFGEDLAISHRGEMGGRL